MPRLPFESESELPFEKEDKSFDAIGVAKDLYQKTIEPAIQFGQSIIPSAVGGLASLAALPFEQDVGKALEYGQRAAEMVPQIPATDIGQQKQEALGHFIEKGAEKVGDVAVTMSPISRFNEPLARGLGESVGQLGIPMLPFAAGRMGRFKGKTVTPEELQAGRQAKQVEQPQIEQLRTGDIPPEYTPMGLPEEVGKGPQSGVLERPITPPPMDLERMMFEQEMKQSMADQSARLSQERGYVPDMRGPDVVEPKPRETIQMEVEAIRKMEETTRPVEQRDFPLRQEVLEQPSIKEAIDNFRREAERLKDMPEQLAALQKQFAAGMKQLGIDKPSDAYGRGLYESGVEPKLPIEKVGEIPSPSGAAHSDFARSKMPTEAPEWDPQRRAFIGELPSFGGVGKKQGGAIDPDVFLRGVFKGKEIPIEARERIGKRQLEGAQTDLDHLLRETIRAKKEGRLDQLKVLVPELNAARESLKRANIYMDKIKEVTSRPKAPVLGMTQFGKKERGSIDFNSDDFRKFKDNLPEPMRGRAKAIYKAVMGEEQSKTALTPSQTEIAQREAIGEVPGLKKALENIEPLEIDPTEVIKRGLKAPELNFKVMGSGKIPKWLANPLGRGITPGGLLTAFAKKNPVVQYVAQEVNRAKIRANTSKHERLLNDKNGLKTLINKLDTPERVGKVLIEMEGKPGELDMSSLSNKERAVVTLLREVADQYLSEMDKVRTELGFTKPIKRRDNWLPGTFAGDFQVNVFRKHVAEDGTSHNEIIGRYGRNTRFGAENARAQLLEKYKNDPSIIIEGVKHRPISRLELRESNRVFSALEDMVGKDDPFFQTIQELKDQMLEAGPYEYLGVRKHFMPKKKVGVSGAKGFDDLIGMKENARDMFENTLQYFEQASEWIELQRAGIKIKDILGSAELRSQRPELMKYIDLYWRTVSKQGTNTSRAIDAITATMADVTGVGETPIRNLTRTIKSALTLSYLTTPTFMAVQVLQPVQMMPTWMAYMRMKGAQGNPALSVALAGTDMSMMMHKEAMTSFGREAFKWAEDNHALIPHMLDDIRPETMTRALGGARDLAGLPLRVVEEYTRRWAYLGFSHFLKSSGMETGPHLYETALNLTNMSMTDYRLHERPLIYQQLGSIGEAMSTLTAFKHNNYGQMLGFIEHAKSDPGRLIDGKTGKVIKDHSTRNAAAAALLAGVTGTMLFSGLSGMHFREDIDNIITGFNNFLLPYLPGATKPIPTTMGYMIQELPDWATFGGISSMTGLDMSSRFSQAKALPEMGAGTIFPYTSDLLRRKDAVVDLITNPSMTTGKKALYANAPNALKGFMEEGNIPGISENVMHPEKGGFRRNDQDKMARYLGGRSLRESKSQIATRQFDVWKVLGYISDKGCINVRYGSTSRKSKLGTICIPMDFTKSGHCLSVSCLYGGREYILC